MAQNGKVDSAKRMPKAPPTQAQADTFANQIRNLLVVDQALDSLINDDVSIGVVESPFIHPLYQVRIKLDALRGKKAKAVAAYARSLRSNSRVTKVA